MKCSNCNYGLCIGTRNADDKDVYECHRVDNKPVYIGTDKEKCDHWVEKDNVVRIF